MSTPTPVSGFVLAGGESRRMGRDKALLDWHGSTLLDHMTNLLGTVCTEVRIVGRDELPDRSSGRGPIEGIATALRVSHTEDNILVAVDLPLLTQDFLNYFKERLNQSTRLLVVCNVDSRYPMCLGIRRSLYATVEDYVSSGKRSVQGFVRGTSCEVIAASQLVPQGFPTRIFSNINTYAEYRAALLADKPL